MAQDVIDKLIFALHRDIQLVHVAEEMRKNVKSESHAVFSRMLYSTDPCFSRKNVTISSFSCQTRSKTRPAL